MKAKDLMTKDVLTVDKDERLESVLDLMHKFRVSKLVVTDRKEIVAVITDGDIADELGALKNRGMPASHLHVTSAMRRQYHRVAPDAELPEILEALTDHSAGILPVCHDRHCVGVVTASDALRLVESERPLAEIMSNHLTVLSPTDRVIHARRQMIDHGIERLPVLDGGKLVGIVGEIDIATGLARIKSTVADHHQPAALTRFLVEDIMQRQVVTAPPETTAAAAAKLMREHDVGSLPVVRGEKLVGIVTRSDLLRTVARQAEAPTRGSKTS